MPRTWSIAPGQEDCRAEGRDRMDADGFACPPYQLEARDGVVTLATGRLRATIRLAGLSISWEMATADGWTTDRAGPADAVCVQLWLVGGRAAALSAGAIRRNATSGSARKAGPWTAQWAGACASVTPTRSATTPRTSDPLYKHILFYVTRGAPATACSASSTTPTRTARSTSAPSAATITACSAASPRIMAISTTM